MFFLVAKRVVISLALFILIVAVVATAAVAWIATGSLAKLDGELSVSGVAAPVTIERDAQGLVSLTGGNRTDIAYALGFVHAQERFFQMDLLRRNSAGELGALFGSRAVNVDKRIRVHQFRKRAEIAVNALSQEHKQLLEAYASGANEGLNQLRSKPFEYWLVQAEPEPWQAADSLLVVYSMYMDLQHEWGEGERSVSAMHDLLPQDWFEFMMPLGGEWDAPLLGDKLVTPSTIPSSPLSDFQRSEQATNSYEYRDQIHVGSNNWAVSGALTDHGGAMVADDMHLGLDVPNIWFRASWNVPGLNSRITGATLPGAPVMVIGSNEYIAWAFTNSYGDYLDIVRLQVSDDGQSYLTPEGWKPFDIEQETIVLKDATNERLSIKLTQWGPVIGKDHTGADIAMRWVAHDASGLNVDLVLLEQATDVEQAMRLATTAGVPGQNLTVADASGQVGWTILGRLPERFGYEDELSKSLISDWSTGERGWVGMLPGDQYPRVLNPDHGRIWTANARIASDQALSIIGNGLYALGARQQQIERRLFEQDTFTEADQLAIQLDDEALFLARWQQLLVSTLSDEIVADYPQLAEFRDHVTNWQGRADKDSVGYLLVKRFRERVIDQTVGHVFRWVENQTPEFWSGYIDNMVEYPTWTLVNQQPPQHLPAGAESWSNFLVEQAIAVSNNVRSEGSSLADSTWGKANSLSITHPLSGAVPFLARWLDMPSEAMSGDTYMPRVQAPSSGASQRMAVSPGREEEGYFHMATGQSGHPLSPFYRAGHRDWVDGVASNFLPADTQYRLTLNP